MWIYVAFIAYVINKTPMSVTDKLYLIWIGKYRKKQNCPFLTAVMELLTTSHNSLFYQYDCF